MPVAAVHDTELFYVTAGKGHPCLVLRGGPGLDQTRLHPWRDPVGDTLELVYDDHCVNARSGSPPEQTMTHARFADDADVLASRPGCRPGLAPGHLPRTRIR